jgi:hypothetical protein
MTESVMLTYTQNITNNEDGPVVPYGYIMRIYHVYWDPNGASKGLYCQRKNSAGTTISYLWDTAASTALHYLPDGVVGDFYNIPAAEAWPLILQNREYLRFLPTSIPCDIDLTIEYTLEPESA